MSPKQPWVRSPACKKSNLLTLGRGEGKYSVYRRIPRKKNEQLMLKRPELPPGFQGRGLKGSVVREEAAGCEISSWLG